MERDSQFSLTYDRMYYVDEAMLRYIKIELTTRVINSWTSCIASHLRSVQSDTQVFPSMSVFGMLVTV
jgi:hypothetical protein